MAEGDNGGEPFIARRAESLDSEGVSQLMQRHTENVFGRVNLDDVIEKANLAITLAGKDDKLLAFAAFNDHPLVKDIKQSEWESWFHSTVQCPLATPLNSLFLRLFVSTEKFSQDALNEILRTVFMAVPLLQYIFLSVATNIKIGKVLESQFTPLPFIEETTPTEGDQEEEEEEPPPPPPITVYATHRHVHYPVLHIRSAVVEDNDDLLPVLQQSSPERLSERYGDYFIAELIESQDDAHQTVVAEVNGRGVGFISVTSEVNLSILWECYQLEPYHGLRKPCDDDEITTVPLLPSSQHLSSDSSHQQQQQESSSDGTSSQPMPTATGALSETSGSSIGSQGSGKKSEVSVASSKAGVSVTAASTPVDPAHSTHTTAPDPIFEKQYTFKGPSNVISVQLFCISEQYESRSIDLLPAVFQKFPEHDLLIISQPQNILEFPLLQHFTRIPPRVDSTISHDLYVIHKCSLLDSFKVRPVRSSDVEGVSSLAASLQAESTIVEDVNRCLAAERDPISEGGTPLYVFIAECLEQIVGVVALRPVESMSYLRSHYNTEDYVYYSQHKPEEHMNIHHLLLSPVFAPHLKHFMKESMRLSHSNNLYYPITSLAPISRQPFSITLALGEMVPIKPRRQILYPSDLGINAPGNEVMNPRPMYTLYHTNRKLSLEPKIVINSRIVFVGASDVCLSALETLIFSPHLKFTNLTLVSPHGLSQTRLPSPLPDGYCFPGDTLHGISLGAWINIVSGAMVAINRTNLDISVLMTDGLQGFTLPYDYLVITTGTQFMLEKNKGGRVPDEGVFPIKGDRDDDARLKKAKELIGDDGRIAIYGSGIDCLSTIQYVMESWEDVDSNRIVWVQPCNTASSASFPNSIKTKIESFLDSAGITRYPGCVFKEYEAISDESADNNPPTTSRLSGIVCERMVDEKAKQKEEVTIKCKAVFCMETRNVDERTFKAVNDACIVYDKRIVVDSDNCTNDQRIFAAGSATKFSRYYRTEWSHNEFNSIEVGQKLAGTILSKLDPTLPSVSTSNVETTNPEKRLIPSYTMPKVMYTHLPGGHYFMNLHKPNLSNSGESQNGIELVTDTENGYFRLWINEYERVQTITVFSSKPFPVSNYICLYNVQEKLLNDMMSRWKDNLITDFFTYFSEDWACAIFHDRFNDFLAEIQGLLETPSEGEEKSLMEKTRDIIEQTGNVSVQYNLKKFLEPSDNLRNALQKRLQGYLHYNGYHLTMYAKPDMI